MLNSDIQTFAIRDSSPCHLVTPPPGRRPRKIIRALLAGTLVAVLPACNARKDFPEPNLGWHSPSFSSIDGILRKVPGPTPDDPPTWIVLFGMPQDPHQGLFALTSPASPTRFAGYSGGERVELKGHILPDATTDAYNGRWYVVDSIQLWSAYR